MIVTKAERAKTLKKIPILVSGMAACGELTNYYTSTDFFYSACQSVAKRVRDQSGVATSDVDSVQIYDNFTPVILFTLEGFGYCGRGEAWEYVKGDRISRLGQLPMNTSGGHTSESYMQGWALHAEAVRQLRGEAGERQVANCDVIQYMCASPIVTSHILRKG